MSVLKKYFVDLEVLETRRLLTGNALPIVSLSVPETFEFLAPADGQIVAGQVVDLDRDGSPDFVVATSSGQIQFWLTEDSGPRKVKTERISGAVADLVVSDVNNDGWLDIVAATDRRLEVWGNAGVRSSDADEWIGVVDLYGVAANVTAVLLEDFDGDGNVDLVVGTDGSGVDVRPGNGEGLFAEGIRYLSDVKAGFVLGAADLDGDQDLDLAVGRWDNQTVTMLVNDSDGIFESGQIISNAGPIRTLELADLDGDQWSDLIVGTRLSRELDHGGENIHIWTGDGLGGFDQHRVNYETAGSPIDLVVEDLNGDGWTDLIVGHDSTFHHPITNNGPGGVSVLLGTQRAVLQAAVRVRSPGAMDVMVVDSPAGKEIISFEQWGNTVTRQHWVMQNAISTANDYSPRSDNLYQRRGSRVGDFDGDGLDDVVVWNMWQEEAELLVYYGRQDGSWDEPVVSSIPRGWNLSELYAGDLNGDGRDDLAFELRSLSNVPYLGSMLAAEDRQFDSLVQRRSPSGFQLMEIVDMDADGVDDWLGTESTSRHRVLILSGDGSSAWSRTEGPELASGEYLRQLVPHDLDQDADHDLMITTSGRVISAINDGTGHLDIASNVRAPSHFSSLGDLNGDGALDVVAGQYGDSQLKVWLGDATGNLTLQAMPTARDNVSSVSIFSGNGFGMGGLVLAYPESSDVLLWQDSGFSDARTVALGFVANEVFLADLVADQAPELVLVEGGLQISASPSTQIAIVESFAGPVATASLISVPLVESVLLPLTSQDRPQIALSHRFGFAVLESQMQMPGDVDRNGLIDAADIDLLCASILNSDHDLAIDLNDDGLLDSQDVDYLVEQILNTVAGDWNLDGAVDFEDFLQMSMHYGQQNAGWSQGDSNCDGVVGFEDFLTLSAHFGHARED